MEIIFAPDPPERPDAAELDLAELRRYRQEIAEQIADLDEREPEDMDSEAYDVWAGRHEDLEDIRDEIEERLEAFGE